MNEKCPFCGMEAQPCSSNSKDHCKWVGEYADKLKGVRSIYCYERELAALKKWGQEAVRYPMTARELYRKVKAGKVMPTEIREAYLSHNPSSYYLSSVLKDREKAIYNSDAPINKVILHLSKTSCRNGLEGHKILCFQGDDWIEHKYGECPRKVWKGDK